MLAAFFLSTYAVRGIREPIGFDTASYIWRTNCVAEGGLRHLDVCVTPDGRSLPGRVGYPLVALPIAGGLSASTITFAAVLPVVAAVAIGLGAAALATSATGSNAVVFAIVAIVVGTSPMVVQMAGPATYADTMLSMVLILGALVVTLLMIEGRRGTVAAAGLLAMAAITHWPTAVLLGATLAVATLPWLPGDWRRARAGEPLRSTVFVRIGTVLSGAAVVWGATLAGLVRAPPEPFGNDPAGFRLKFRTTLPAYGLPVALPAAALGAYRVARDGAGRHRVPTMFLLGVLGSWLGLVVVGVVASFAGATRLPPNRIIMLALPIPILGAFGLVRVGEWLRTHSLRLAVALIAVGVMAVAAVGYVVWLRVGDPILRTAWLGDASTAARYLDGSVPEDQPVVVIAPGPATTANHLMENIRVVLPPTRIGTVSVRIGLPPGVDRMSRPEPDRTVFLLLRSASPGFERLAATAPDRLVAPNLLVLQGPLPSEAIDPVPPPRIEVGYPGLVVLALATIAILGLVGYGWTVAAVGAAIRPFERLAVSPAFGLAAILLAGLIGDAVGLTLTGSGGTVILLSAGGGGAAVGLAVRHR